MGTRLELQILLEEQVLKSENVYFQPPDNLTIQYPAIVYELANIVTEFASNTPYRHTDRYQLTLIDRRPDSPFINAIKQLPMCVFSRHFVADGLHHYTFNIYF